MVGKLAYLAIADGADPDARLVRDEIRQVIHDTERLLTGEVTLDEFLDAPTWVAA